MAQITIATLNISSASKERARRLLDEWVAPTSYDVYVLTETSEGQGTALLMSEFQNAGWATFQRPTAPKDRGVAIASRLRGSVSSRLPDNDPAPGRSIILHLNTSPRLELIGMYVPNRGNDWTKTERKRAFLECWLSYWRSNVSVDVQRILLGDLNVVPPDQRPVFLPQQQFEYDWFVNLDRVVGLYDAAVRHGSGRESTWVAHNGEGYTYDHIMPQKSLAERVVAFQYDHSTRQERSLTDHSALILTIAVDAMERLSVSPIGEPRQTQLF